MTSKYNTTCDSHSEARAIVLPMCLVVTHLGHDLSACQALSRIDKHVSKTIRAYLKREKFHKVIRKDLDRQDIFGRPGKSCIAMLKERADIATLANVLPQVW